MMAYVPFMLPGELGKQGEFIHNSLKEEDAYRPAFVDVPYIPILPKQIQN